MLGELPAVAKLQVHHRSGREVILYTTIVHINHQAPCSNYSEVQSEKNKFDHQLQCAVLNRYEELGRHCFLCLS